MTQPAILEISLAAISVIGLVLLITAIFSISRAMREELVSTGAALAWTFLVLLVPVLGPLGWFYFRRRKSSGPAPISGAGEQGVN